MPVATQKMVKNYALGLSRIYVERLADYGCLS